MQSEEQENSFWAQHRNQLQAQGSHGRHTPHAYAEGSDSGENF